MWVLRFWFKKRSLVGCKGNWGFEFSTENGSYQKHEMLAKLQS